MGKKEGKALENAEGKATGSESFYVQRKEFIKDFTLLYRNADIYVGWGGYLDLILINIKFILLTFQYSVPLSKKTLRHHF